MQCTKEKLYNLFCFLVLFLKLVLWPYGKGLILLKLILFEYSHDGTTTTRTMYDVYYHFAMIKLTRQCLIWQVDVSMQDNLYQLWWLRQYDNGNTTITRLFTFTIRRLIRSFDMVNGFLVIWSIYSFICFLYCEHIALII